MATIASLIETAKLNDVEPLSYLTDALIKIMKGHPNSQLDDLLAWAYAASTMPATVRRPLATGDAR
ncbi:transposase IS66-like protein [Sinorhizobium medicae]|uniref:Transposase IS66 C-terminal domain-containing protein n=1 Tax=Sinorhizobium medicae TaxID=110321 RepID=A0A508WPC1_9HYPH|nr:transposase IS66-like protein [Sinorhizobium medicae]VTZ59358.1 hypothetical protein EMEDMD4_1060040 [Sinorhizobium medicae]